MRTAVRTRSRPAADSRPPAHAVPQAFRKYDGPFRGYSRKTNRPYRKVSQMGLGGCIILIAVGAILTFATDWEMKGANLDVIGLILMAVGIIGVVTFSSIAKRRRVVVPPTTPVVTEERRPYE